MAVWRARRAGQDPVDIALEYGISRVRIRQICKRYDRIAAEVTARKNRENAHA